MAILISSMKWKQFWSVAVDIDGQPHFGYVRLCPGFSRPDDLVEEGPGWNPSLWPLWNWAGLNMTGIPEEAGLLSVGPYRKIQSIKSIFDHHHPHHYHHVPFLLIEKHTKYSTKQQQYKSLKYMHILIFCSYMLK